MTASHTKPMPELTDSSFNTFADFQPTRFDCRGLGADEDNASWLVVPVFFHPRTAGILEESNWAALESLISETDPEGNDSQGHLFGHWTTDYELYIVRPGSAVHTACEAFCAALADYPVADDEDFSHRERAAVFEAAQDAVRRFTVELDGAELDNDAIASMVLEQLEQRHNVECTEEGAYIDSTEVERALTELGYVLCEDDTWRPESETEQDCSTSAGDVVSVSAHTSEEGKGLTYPAFIGTLLEDCNGSGWDVVEVIDNTTGETISVYSFDVSER